MRSAHSISALFQAASRAALTLNAAIVSSRRETGGSASRKAHRQFVPGGLYQRVQGGVDRGVIGVLSQLVGGRGSANPARCFDGHRQIVIDVRVDPGERELDASDGGFAATVEERAPAAGRTPAGERGAQRFEVQRRELHVQLRDPRRVAEAACGATCAHGLRYFQVEPVKPFQAVDVRAERIDPLHDADYRGDGGRRGRDRG